MVVEADHVSGKVQTSGPSPPKSKVSPAGSKTSFFVRKAGFVIPKNKLSGSLVPLFRGSKKYDAKLLNDEAVNVIQRETKWGPDLTLESSVRKGRALAYQARINQISEQLAIGTPESEDNEDSFSANESKNGKRSDLHLSNEESELLVLERREIIGELMKLNPSYKAPADYKPLMKEAKVQIPFKEHPGYNFIGSIFGLANDTLKRLEKETGARIKVYGIRADTGAKVEITSADGKEIRNAFEELYVHISADSFNKIDAAVALVELLVTPVSVQQSVSSTNSVSITPDDNISPVSSVATPTLAVPSTGTLQGQFPFYSQPWPNQVAPPPHSQSGMLVPSTNPTPRGIPFLEISPVPLNNPSNLPPSFVSVSSSLILPRPSQLPHVLHMQQEPPMRNSQVPLRIPPPLSSTPSQSSPVIPMIRPPVTFPAESRLFPQSQGSFLPLRPLVGSESVPSTSSFGQPLQNFTRASFGPVPPPPFKVAIPRPLQPSSIDFTFQTYRHPQHWQGRLQSMPPFQGQSLFARRPMPHDLRHPPLLRPQMSDVTFFAGTPPPRPGMPQQRPFVPVTPRSQMNFHSGQRFASPQMHRQAVHPGRTFRGMMGNQQVFDPFPGTAPSLMSSSRPALNQSDGDPEYDDLMASVGVK